MHHIGRPRILPPEVGGAAGTQPSRERFRSTDQLREARRLNTALFADISGFTHSHNRSIPRSCWRSWTRSCVP